MGNPPTRQTRSFKQTNHFAKGRSVWVDGLLQPNKAESHSSFYNEAINDIAVLYFKNNFNNTFVNEIKYNGFME